MTSVVTANLGYHKMGEYQHRNMGLVVDVGPHHAPIRSTGYSAAEGGLRWPFGLQVENEPLAVPCA